MPHTWPPDEVIPPADNSQKEAAETFRQYGRLIIEAAPGTGKTFLGIYLALCAFHLGWTSSECPTLFLTFSRNARVQIEQALQTFRKNCWMKADDEKAFKVYNYHAFYFELIQQKAGIWGCSEKLRPASIEEYKTRLADLVPQHRNNLNALNQASLVYALQRFPIGDLLYLDTQLQLDQNTIERLNIGAADALRNGRPQYDDFAPLFLNLLELCPELVEWLRIKYPVIILDEFQDTDIIQWKILQKIDPVHPVILYDKYQMIYEWRGARLDRLDQVKQHLSIQNEQEKQLTDIHRCGGQDSLVQFIQELRIDNLLGNFVDGRRNRPWLSIHNLQPGRDKQYIPAENRCLAWFRFNSRMIDFRETTAIITRTNFLADYLFENLRVRPERGGHFLCRWIGSNNNPDEKIRDWIWRLRTIERDSEFRAWFGSLLDAMLPNKILRELGVYFAKEFLSDQSQLFSRKKKNIFKAIKSSWLTIWNLLTIGNFRILSVGINMVLDTANEIVSDKGHLDPDLVYYLKQLGLAAEKFQPGDAVDKWLEFCDYLENSHLRASSLKIRTPTPGLYILTIHQSKGREFDHVIIPWLSGSGEPSKTADGRRFPNKLDYAKLEDRKLLYVAITRTRRRVTIVYPQEDPSPFLMNWKLIV